MTFFEQGKMPMAMITGSHDGSDRTYGLAWMWIVFAVIIVFLIAIMFWGKKDGRRDGHDGYGGWGLHNQLAHNREASLIDGLKAEMERKNDNLARMIVEQNEKTRENDRMTRLESIICGLYGHRGQGC